MSDDLNNDGNQNNQGDVKHPWMAQLPDNLKANESLGEYDSIGKVAETLLETRGKMANMVPKLGENATPEEKSSFFKALGRPETISDYELDRGTMPEGYPYDEGWEQTFRKASIEANLTKDQAKILHSQILKYGTDLYSQSYEEMTKKEAEMGEKLKTHWGDKYEENEAKAMRVLKRFGGEEAVKFIEDDGLNNEPIIKEFLHRVYEFIGDDVFTKGTDFGGNEKEVRSIDGGPMLSFPSMQKN